MDPVPGGSFQPGEHLAGGFVNSAVSCTCECSAGSKGGARDACPPGAQILSISCSFGENLAKSFVGAPLGSWRPHLGEIPWIRHWNGPESETETDKRSKAKDLQAK